MPEPTDLAALRTLAASPHPMATVCGVAANEIERLRNENASLRAYADARQRADELQMKMFGGGGNLG